ncbi:MAG: Gfo/Idh/MocA family protein [Fimbriimonas sp.]
MAQNTSRREFLKITAAAAVGVAAASRGFARKAQSPNDRIRYGIIGAGGKGWSGTEQAAQTGDIVALCDVDSNALAQAGEVHPKASKHTDYRKMLIEHGKEFDAVIISIPDHHHAFASSLAMRLGKHVYCEKPMTRTITEARTIQDIAKKTKVATQMGNQGSANDALRKVVALAKAGTFGKIKEVHCWTDRPAGWWPQGVPRPATKPVPANVDFDIWLGPSPLRPFADGYHPFAWRGWWDFGTGSMGDIACHCMNLPFRACDLRDPIAVQAQTSGHNRDSYPLWSIIRYEFAKTKERPEVTLTWYDGGKQPPQELAPGVKYQGNGSLMVFENATIYSPGEYGGSAVIVGGGELPNIEFEKSPGHMQEFARAIKGGPAAHSNFVEYAGPLTEMMLVGNLGVWADGPRLKWDAKRNRIQGGSKEYDRLIKPEYRAGWSLSMI